MILCSVVTSQTGPCLHCNREVLKAVLPLQLSQVDNVACLIRLFHLILNVKVNHAFVAGNKQLIAIYLQHALIHLSQDHAVQINTAGSIRGLMNGNMCMVCASTW